MGKIAKQRRRLARQLDRIIVDIVAKYGYDGTIPAPIEEQVMIVIKRLAEMGYRGSYISDSAYEPDCTTLWNSDLLSWSSGFCIVDPSKPYGYYD
jgi:hypothetical protein